MKKILSNMRKPVFRSILLSYGVFCIIILAVSGIGYVNSYRVLRRTTAKYGQQQAYTYDGTDKQPAGHDDEDDGSTCL